MTLGKRYRDCPMQTLSFYSPVRLSHGQVDMPPPKIDLWVCTSNQMPHHLHSDQEQPVHPLLRGHDSIRFGGYNPSSISNFSASEDVSNLDSKQAGHDQRKSRTRAQETLLVVVRRLAGSVELIGEVWERGRVAGERKNISNISAF